MKSPKRSKSPALRGALATSGLRHGAAILGLRPHPVRLDFRGLDVHIRRPAALGSLLDSGAATPGAVRHAIVPFGEDHWRAAVDAYLRYGKGRHPAALNFGDCLAYATASLADEPLLAAGADFSKTDLKRT